MSSGYRFPKKGLPETLWVVSHGNATWLYENEPAAKGRATTIRKQQARTTMDLPVLIWETKPEWYLHPSSEEAGRQAMYDALP